MTSRLESRLLKVIELQAAALVAALRNDPVLALAPDPDRVVETPPAPSAAYDPTVLQACRRYSFGERQIERDNRIFAQEMARDGATAESIVAAIKRVPPSDEDDES